MVVDTENFLTLLSKYTEDQIEHTIHTFFRLSQKQKQIYTEKELRQIITKEKPFLVGLQYNGNYAAFYLYHNKTLKIIISFKTRKVNIVTFYFINKWQIPLI